MKRPFGKWSWLRTKLPAGWTKAQLFWCAFLWLADEYRRELQRQFEQALYEVYADLGQKLWDISTRPSPFLARSER